MNPTLKVLYLEDNPADVELCRHVLRQAGYEPHILHVDNRQAFVEGLADTFDVVLADYSLPQFDAFSALRLMQERGVDLPFIVVSGTVGEETAVDLIKQGADDYLLKDRLGRLGAAIESARGQRRLKSERAAIERALRAHDRLFRAVVEHATEGLALLSKDLTLTYLSPTAERMVGMEMKDFPGLDPVSVVHPEDQAQARQILQASIETPRAPQSLDVRMRRKNGTWRWVECTIDNRLDQPEVQAVVINMRDVDGRRRAEEALRQSEENYRLLFSGNPQPMWVYDRDTLAILQVNDAAVHAYGYAADEFLRMTVLDLHPPEVHERLREVAATLAGRIRRPGIWPQVRKDGSGLEADITTHDLEFEGRPARLVMAFDVTERERARAELETSERRYRELTEEAPIGIYRTAPDGRILFVNPALARMLGYDDPKDLMARSLESGAFEASYSRAEFKARLEAQGEIRGLEASWTRKDGSRLYIREHARVVRSQDGDGVYYEGTVEDISEQKQVQDELRRRSEQILLLYEAGRALGETLDLESLFDRTFQAVSRVMDCSGFYISTFEPEPQLIRCAYARHGGRKLDASSFPSIPLEPEGQGTQSRVIRSGESLYLPDYRATWRTARTRFLVDENGIADAPASDEADIDRSALLVPLKLEEKVTGVVQVFSQQADAFRPDQMAFLDALAPQLAAAMANARLFRRSQEEIRERRQTEHAIRQLSEFNESIVTSMSEGIVLEDPDGTFSFVNPAAASMMGYRPEELLGKPFSLVMPTDQIELVRAANQRRAHGESDRYELRLRRKDGSMFPVLVSGSPRFQDGEFAGTIAVFTDISELKAAQADLARRAHELEELYQTSLEVSSQPDLHALLQAIVERASALLGVEAADIYLLDPDGQTLHSTVGIGVPAFVRNRILQRSEGLTGLVLERGETVTVEDYRAWQGRVADFSNVPFRRSLGVPLKIGHRILGVLNLADTVQTGTFEPEDIRLVELFADQAAIAVENARLLQAERERTVELERARGLVDALSRVAAEAERAGEPSEVMEVLGRELRPQDISAWIGLIDTASGDLIVRYASIAGGLLEQAARLAGQPVYGYRIPRDNIEFYDAMLVQGQSLIVPSTELLRSLAPQLPGLVVDSLLKLLGIGSDTTTLCLPLAVENRVLGGLFLWGPGLAPGDLPAFSVFASQIAGVMEKVRLLEETRHRANQLQALYQTSLEINAQPDLQKLLQAIVERATTLLGVQSGGLYLLRPDGETLEFAVVHGMLTKYKGTTLRRGEALSGMVLETGQTIVVEDYTRWPKRSAQYADTTFRRIVAVPLRVGARIVGVLNAADMDKPGTFTPEEIRLAEMFADQAAIAVENARLLEETRLRAAHLEGVASVSSALRVAADRNQMTGIIADQLVRLLDTPHVGIVLRVDPEHVAMAVGRGLAERMVGIRGPADAGIAGYVLGGGVTFESHQASLDERILHREIFRGADHALAVPLAVQHQRIGMIIAARSRPFEDEDIRLLTAVAEMAGNAIHRAGVMETLEQRVAERTQDLESANVRLQELDQLKSTFVSNVSHELRTPITNILLYLDLLEQPGREDRRPTYMGILRGESGRLNRLIEDLLTLSRLERGSISLDLEPQVLDAIIAEVLASQEARAHFKQIELVHDPNPDMPPTPLARSPMVQVLTNLIGNAVAYAPSGATVTVQTRLERTRGERYATVRVHNSAPAIPEEDLPHLFERFYRGRSAAESGEAGTGLGLSICKEIVERHRGWIEVESAPETGTAFTVWLPLDLNE